MGCFEPLRGELHKAVAGSTQPRSPVGPKVHAGPQAKIGAAKRHFARLHHEITEVGATDIEPGQG